MSRALSMLVLVLVGGCSFDLDALHAEEADSTSEGAVADSAAGDSVVRDSAVGDSAGGDSAGGDSAGGDSGATTDTNTPVDAGEDPPLDPAVCKAAGTSFACFQCCTTKLPIATGNAWKGSSGCFCHPSHCKFQCKDTACSKGMVDADATCAACLNSNLAACGPDAPPSSKRLVDCVGGC